ncbi:S8/S53 family peptidase [Janibacter sp. G1551]|uniref:S8/S53 family peptidase n=1 Tax=Janibacter sp. G1551 TaxID=3420440 RepID=UPI003CFFF120
MTDTSRTPGAARRPQGPAPVPGMSRALAERFGARVLDPSNARAVRTTGAKGVARRTPQPTAYLADSLLVRGLPGRRGARTIAQLDDIAAGLGNAMRLTVTDRETELARTYDADERQAAFDHTWWTRVHLEPADDGPAAPADAWELLAAARQAGLDHTQVALDHLVTACPTLDGVGGHWGGVGGHWGGVGGHWGGVGQGIAEYGEPGIGGRTPVMWSAPDPRLTAPKVAHVPVVAILDTGVGPHPWFTADDGVTFLDGITEDVECDQQPIGIRAHVGTGTPTDPEYRGVVTDPLNGGLDRQPGHGTFIAGIIRQRCPQAEILALPVMPADGAVAEHEVIVALNQLLRRHLSGEGRIDVLNLSMGYYHESPDEAADDGPLLAALRALAEAGVAVVAAAGNDGTDHPFFPAAHRPVITTGVPMTSVGALNPDQSTVALFSNNGTWINAHAPGAGVVSTVPTTLSGSRGRSIHVDRHDPLPRATVDPDDFSSGFALWSGTSFAAPWIAGDIAAALTGGGTVADAVASVVTDNRAHLAARATGVARW